jgi:hypothetical protein
MLEALHSNSCLGQVNTPGHRPVVREKERDVARQVWLSRVAQGWSSAGRVRDAWHLAQQEHDFREHVTREPLPGNRERGGRWRMGMYDRATVLPLSIDPQVQI